MEAAITREKQIKAGSRAKKLALIEAMNPNWDDRFDQSFDWIASLRSQ
jgi:putative endonuclease